MGVGVGVPFDFQVTDKSLSQMEQNSQIGPKMSPRCLFDFNWCEIVNEIQPDINLKIILLETHLEILRWSLDCHLACVV